MTTFSMQVACGCRTDHPSPCEQIEMWDGDNTGGWTEGRRYLWRCTECGVDICVNMKLIVPPMHQ